MRKIVARALPAVLSLALLIMLAATGSGLRTTHALPVRGTLGEVRALLRGICAPQHAVCTGAVPGVLGTTLLIGLARVRDAGTLSERVSPVLADANIDASSPTSDISAASLATAHAAAEALLGWVALGVAFLWAALLAYALPPRRAAQPLPTLRICEHRVSPAP